MDYLLIHVPKTGGTSLLVSGIPGGHHVRYSPNSQFKYLTIVRNPVDRTISHFSEINEKNSNRIDLGFIKKYSNFQTNWLIDKLNVDSLDKVIEILKKEFIVLTTNNLTNKVKDLGFNIKKLNTTRREYKITNSEMNLIKKYNELDFKLFNLFNY